MVSPNRTVWFSLTFTRATYPATLFSTGMIRPSTCASSVFSRWRPECHAPYPHTATATRTTAATATMMERRFMLLDLSNAPFGAGQ
jgi:hypothetical protein